MFMLLWSIFIVGKWSDRQKQQDYGLVDFDDRKWWTNGLLTNDRKWWTTGELMIPYVHFFNYTF